MISLPQFLIQARPKNSPGLGGWAILDTAWNAEHAERKLAHLVKSPEVEGLEIVSIPNAPSGDTSALETAIKSAVALLVAAITSEMNASKAIEETPSELKAELPAPAIADSVPAAPQADAAPQDSTPAETPLPFSVGDRVRDIHSGNEVTVTNLYALDGSGKGFDWVRSGSGETGFVPLDTAHTCFEFVARPKSPALDGAPVSESVSAKLDESPTAAASAKSGADRSEPGAAPTSAPAPAPVVTAKAPRSKRAEIEAKPTSTHATKGAHRATTPKLPRALKAPRKAHR